MRWLHLLMVVALAGCLGSDEPTDDVVPVDPPPVEPETVRIDVHACAEACPEPARNTVVEVREVDIMRSDVGGFTDSQGYWTGEVPKGSNVQVRVGGLAQYTMELKELSNLQDNVTLEIVVYKHHVTINHTITLPMGYNEVGIVELSNALHPDPKLNAVYIQRLWAFGVTLTWESGIGNDVDIAPCAGYGDEATKFTTDAEPGPNTDGDYEVRLSLSDAQNSELSAALQRGEALRVCYEVRSDTLALQDIEIHAELGGYFIGPLQDGIA